MRRLVWLLAFAAFAAIACGSAAATVGPLTLEPPDGWLVTDREADTIKVTNGTIADETSTKAGTATAVFDVYVSSDQSVGDFRDVLRENNVEAEEEQIEIDGHNAVVLSYESTAFGPSTEIVFVPDWRVRIVYRAAFPDAEAAFARHQEEFRAALETIRFEGRPPRRA